MQRTGNTIGAEGRRQHNEDDPQNGDMHRMQERLADAEIEEGREEVAAESGGETDAVEATPQADGVPHDDDESPEETEPRTGPRPTDESVTPGD
jgi:hypothetical protein